MTRIGEVLPVRKARATWLLRRHGDQWLIEAVRAMPTDTTRKISARRIAKMRIS